MTKDFDKFSFRKLQDDERPKSVETANKMLKKIDEKVADMKESKPWITEAEKKDVLDKAAEVKKWLEDILGKQEKLAKHEDPVFKPTEVTKKLKTLQKLYSKVAKKSKPAPPKEEKKPEDANNKTESANNNTTEGEATNSTKSEDTKSNEEKKEDTKAGNDSDAKKSEDAKTGKKSEEL